MRSFIRSRLKLREWLVALTRTPASMRWRDWGDSSTEGASCAEALANSILDGQVEAGAAAGAAEEAGAAEGAAEGLGAAEGAAEEVRIAAGATEALVRTVPGAQLPLAEAAERAANDAERAANDAAGAAAEGGGAEGEEAGGSPLRSPALALSSRLLWLGRSSPSERNGDGEGC